MTHDAERFGERDGATGMNPHGLENAFLVGLRISSLGQGLMLLMAYLLGRRSKRKRRRSDAGTGRLNDPTTPALFLVATYPPPPQQ